MYLLLIYININYGEKLFKEIKTGKKKNKKREKKLTTTTKICFEMILDTSRIEFKLLMLFD